MAQSATRFASTLAALLLGSTALCGSAQAGWFDFDSKKESAATQSPPAESRSSVVKSDTVKPAETLDGSIEQARGLRQTGNHAEAIKHLSQLMIVASDDGRVVSEYGKALVETGRAQEGVSFLTRAEQLRPTDWTIFSALGVAHDQLGKHQDAQTAYERALTLKPEDASVLNNYALSRMLAKDPEGARKLAARAESAGGKSDSKIARNIAMIRDMAPATQDVATAAPAMAPPPVAAPKPASVASLALPPAEPAPVAETAPIKAAEVKPVPVPAAPISAAAPVRTATKDIKPSQSVATAAPSGVVMQRVPVDPLAGPVAATKPPRPLAATVNTAAKSEAPALKPAVPVKAAEIKPTPEAKPVPVKAAEIKPVPVKTAEPAANAKTIAIKAADVKPITDAKAVKTAETKPIPAAEVKPAPVKAAAKDDAATKTAAANKPIKDGVPSLRMSANAY